jgi:hypothetical protein
MKMFHGGRLKRSWKSEFLSFGLVAFVRERKLERLSFSEWMCSHFPATLGALPTVQIEAKWYFF